MLAGLIRDDERTVLNGVPGLSDIPLIGRLFANNHRETQQTDIILTLTPHIIRILDLTEADLRPFRVGRDSIGGLVEPLPLEPPRPAEPPRPDEPVVNPLLPKKPGGSVRLVVVDGYSRQSLSNCRRSFQGRLTRPKRVALHWCETAALRHLRDLAPNA